MHLVLRRVHIHLLWKYPSTNWKHQQNERPSDPFAASTYHTPPLPGHAPIYLSNWRISSLPPDPQATVKPWEISAVDRKMDQYYTSKINLDVCEAYHGERPR